MQYLKSFLAINGVVEVEMIVVWRCFDDHSWYGHKNGHIKEKGFNE